MYWPFPKEENISCINYQLEYVTFISLKHCFYSLVFFVQVVFLFCPIYLLGFHFTSWQQMTIMFLLSKTLPFSSNNICQQVWEEYKPRSLLHLSHSILQQLLSCYVSLTRLCPAHYNNKTLTDKYLYCKIVWDTLNRISVRLAAVCVHSLEEPRRVRQHLRQALSVC